MRIIFEGLEVPLFLTATSTATVSVFGQEDGFQKLIR